MSGYLHPTARPIIDYLLDGLDQDAPPRVVGVCGPPGSGKSTACAQVRSALYEYDVHAVVLSLDDFYLPRSVRAHLAREVHPLLAFRGAPGTHDMGALLKTLQALREGQTVHLPCFDKLLDDRIEPLDKTPLPRAPDVILVEGWCIGATPQKAEALRVPVNALEANEDPKGVWRQYVNDALAGPYGELNDACDGLIQLLAPSLEVIVRWRYEQELATIARITNQREFRVGMDRFAVRRFVEPMRRLIEHIQIDMPERADLLITLGDDRSVIRVRRSPRQVLADSKDQAWCWMWPE